jgi:hypothetical protein
LDKVNEGINIAMSFAKATLAFGVEVVVLRAGLVAMIPARSESRRRP